ncbi:MAG: helix-turn-helix transcriptional regulator [Asticcacaulis sp.]
MSRRRAQDPHLSSALRMLRLRSGKSLAEVAPGVGVSQQSLSRWGKRHGQRAGRQAGALPQGHRFYRRRPGARNQHGLGGRSGAACAVVDRLSGTA